MQRGCPVNDVKRWFYNPDDDSDIHLVGHHGAKPQSSFAAAGIYISESDHLAAVAEAEQRVREEERQKHLGWKCRENALSEALEAVAAVPDFYSNSVFVISRDKALATIEALGGKRPLGVRDAATNVHGVDPAGDTV